MKTIEELMEERKVLKESLFVIEDELRERFKCGYYLKEGDVVENLGKKGIIERLIFNNCNDISKPSKIIWRKIKENGEPFKYSSELSTWFVEKGNVKVIGRV